MPRLLTLLIAKLRAFRTAERAVAIVEFALVTPVLLTLYMGTIEVSDLIAVDRRVTIISGTVGDLVARTDGTLTNTMMTDYFKAAEGIIVPYSKTPLKQVLTLVSVNAAGTGATVLWSRGTASATGLTKTANSAYTLPPAMLDISKSSWVIVSETYYSYRPFLGYVLKNNINLHRVSYYLPRYNKNIPFDAAN